MAYVDKHKPFIDFWTQRHQRASQIMWWDCAKLNDLAPVCSEFHVSVKLLGGYKSRELFLFLRGKIYYSMNWVPIHVLLNTSAFYSALVLEQNLSCQHPNDGYRAQKRTAKMRISWENHANTTESLWQHAIVDGIQAQFTSCYLAKTKRMTLSPGKLETKALRNTSQKVLG